MTAQGQDVARDAHLPRSARPGAGSRGAESLRKYLRTALQTYHHPVGTCRIGEDDLAVVDTDLRVHGIDGLRVADASVMPSIVSGNTMATVYGIAERAAADITAEAAPTGGGRSLPGLRRSARASAVHADPGPAAAG